MVSKSSLLCAASLSVFFAGAAGADDVGGEVFDNSSHQYDFPECTDPQGQTAEFLNYDEHNIRPMISIAGVRYIDAQNITGPVIAYRPEKIEPLSPIGLDFLFAHECYHVTSGDAYNAYLNFNARGEYQSRDELQDIEDDADCHAAATLADRYTQDNLNTLRSDLVTLLGERDTQARMPLITQCFESGKPPQP